MASDKDNPSVVPDLAASSNTARTAAETTSSSTADDSVIEERISIPAVRPSESQGGEWVLLVSKLQGWWATTDLASRWPLIRRLILLIALLVILNLVNRFYSGILTAIAAIPMAPRLLELVGAAWLTSYALRYLARAEDRRATLSTIRQGIGSVLGRSID
ncbi:proline-rich region [cyanobiont of Ornithocercus magnificus]|nr:proline-rich region [cyanobiont of Ornithocercus magnificus]